MVTKTKTNKKVTAKGLVQVSQIPAEIEIERMVDYFKQDMGFKDLRLTAKVQTQGKQRSFYGSATKQIVYKSDDGKGSYELQISSEHLNRSAMQIATTVRYILVLFKAFEDGVRVTSGTNDIYHNRKFLDIGTHYGLDLYVTSELESSVFKKHGFGLIKGFNPIYEAIVLQELKPDDSAFTVVRQIIEAKKKTKAPTKMIKWTCECGVNVRCAVDLDATCNECGTDFVKDDGSK